jgi:hypothetical protein
VENCDQLPLLFPLLGRTRDPPLIHSTLRSWRISALRHMAYYPQR